MIVTVFLVKSVYIVIMKKSVCVYIKKYVFKTDISLIFFVCVLRRKEYKRDCVYKMKVIWMLHSEHLESPHDTQQIMCLGFPVSERECRPLIKPKLSESCNYANEPYSFHSPHLLIGPPWGQNISFSFAFLNYNS